MNATKRFWYRVWPIVTTSDYTDAKESSAGIAEENVQPAYVPKNHVSAASTSGRKKSGAVLMITFPKRGIAGGAYETIPPSFEIRTTFLIFAPVTRQPMI